MLTHHTHMMHGQGVADLAQRDKWISKGRALGLTDDQMIYHEACVNRLAGMLLLESNRDLWRAGWGALLCNTLAGDPPMPANPARWAHGIWVAMTGLDPLMASPWSSPTEETQRRLRILMATTQERWDEITARTVEA